MTTTLLDIGKEMGLDEEQVNWKQMPRLSVVWLSAPWSSAVSRIESETGSTKGLSDYLSMENL